ncbi:unnamed protein product [Schistosoma curassoni]|uniref:Uncharacterized protein n=1 Tax=Schistosoma curassoni TaxID=6186 RepID=A0A183JRP0_9TREM|nr:unnamed protein product [Schistosoma curassoni]
MKTSSLVFHQKIHHRMAGLWIYSVLKIVHNAVRN